MASPFQTAAFGQQSPQGGGVAEMTALVRNRAMRRKSALGDNVTGDSPAFRAEPTGPDALESINDSTDVSDPFPATAPGGARPVAEEGESPFRTASMTEGDEPEIRQVAGNCADGMCGTPMGGGMMMAPQQNYGLPPGAVVISERVVGSPQPVAGQMAAGIAPSPTYVDQIRQAYDEFAKKENKTPGDYANFNRTLANIYQGAAQGRGLVESRALQNWAAAHVTKAANFDEQQLLSQEVEKKRAGEVESLALARDNLEFNKRLQFLNTPQGAALAMREVVSGEGGPDGGGHPLGGRSDIHPDTRAALYMESVKKGRRMSKGEQQQDGGKNPADQQQQDEITYEQLRGFAWASDVSKMIVQAEMAGQLPFGNEGQRQRGTMMPMRAAKEYYGKMQPDKMYNALFFELQPAVEQRLYEAKTSILRRQKGDPEAQLSPEDAYNIQLTAAGHVDALYSALGGQPNQSQPQPQAQPQGAVPAKGAVWMNGLVD